MYLVDLDKDFVNDIIFTEVDECQLGTDNCTQFCVNIAIHAAVA